MIEKSKIWYFLLNPISKWFIMIMIWRSQFEIFCDISQPNRFQISFNMKFLYQKDFRKSRLNDDEKMLKSKNRSWHRDVTRAWRYRYRDMTSPLPWTWSLPLPWTLLLTLPLNFQVYFSLSHEEIFFTNLENKVRYRSCCSFLGKKFQINLRKNWNFLKNIKFFWNVLHLLN